MMRGHHHLLRVPRNALKPIAILYLLSFLYILFVIYEAISFDEGARFAKSIDPCVTKSVTLMGTLQLKELQSDFQKSENEIYSRMWGSLPKFLRRSRFVLANLETVLTFSTSALQDRPVRLSPLMSPTLQAVGIDFVNLANSHFYDFGVSGVNETCSTLNLLKIQHGGVGLLDIASSSVNVERHGSRIEVISAADGPRNLRASDSSIGLWHMNLHANKDKVSTARLKKSLKSIASDSSSPDKVCSVFSLNWGPNFRFSPSSLQRSVAHHIIDDFDGIDVIWGHGSHHMQGIEMYKGKIIAYGLGLTIADSPSRTQQYHSELGLILDVHFARSNRRITYADVFVTRTNNSRTDFLKDNDPDSVWVIDTLTRLCKDLNTEVSVVHHGCRLLRFVIGNMFSSE